MRKELTAAVLSFYTTTCKFPRLNKKSILIQEYNRLHTLKSGGASYQQSAEINLFSSRLAGDVIVKGCNSKRLLSGHLQPSGCLRYILKNKNSEK